MRQNKAISALLLLFLCVPVGAQTTRPKVQVVTQSGGQRGTTVTLTVSGVNIGYGSQLVFGTKGIIVESLQADPAPAANAKNPNSKLVAQVRLTADAPLGRHAFRVVTPRGISDIGYLVIGQWREVAEKEPNNGRGQTQALENLPLTVLGKSDTGEDVDVYTVALKAGETCVFEAQAGSMGSPMEPVLTLTDAQGREVGFAAALRRPDATLLFTPRATGTYTLTVRDIRYLGGGTHLYRLTVGAIPYITQVFPAGGKVDTITPLALTGVNFPRQTQWLPLTNGMPTTVTFPLGNATSNLVRLDLSETPEMVETEPNDTPQTAPLVPVPVTVSGRVMNEDCFRFAAEKGQRYTIEAIASRIGSPLDAVVEVLDTTGRVHATNDDARGRDAFLEFVAPEKTEYVVRLRDLNERQETELPYRLRIALARPDFTLTFAPDCPNLAPGDRVALVVTASRLYGFNEAIDLAITGLPPGVQVVGVPRIPAGQNEVRLTLATEATAMPTPATPLRIVGTAGMLTHAAQSLHEEYVKQDGKVVRTTRPSVMPLVALAPEADLKTALSIPTLILKAGQTAELKVTVTRKVGVGGKVPLIVTGLPAGVSATNTEIPADKNEVVVTFKAEASAAATEASVLIAARAVVDELRFSDHEAPPLALTVVK